MYISFRKRNSVRRAGRTGELVTLLDNNVGSRRNSRQAERLRPARPGRSRVNVTIYINLSLRNPPADRYEKIDSAGVRAVRRQAQRRRYATTRSMRQTTWNPRPPNGNAIREPPRDTPTTGSASNRLRFHSARLRFFYLPTALVIIPDLPREFLFPRRTSSERKSPFGDPWIFPPNSAILHLWFASIDSSFFDYLTYFITLAYVSVVVTVVIWLIAHGNRPYNYPFTKFTDYTKWCNYTIIIIVIIEFLKYRSKQ